MKYFLDSFFVIALFNKKDMFHKKAVEIYESFDDTDIIYLTDAIILEIANSLSHPSFRNEIVKFIKTIRKSSYFKIHKIDTELMDEGIKIFSKYKDKDWGLVDCISIYLMKKMKITSVLTNDKHFTQAGFKTIFI